MISSQTFEAHTKRIGELLTKAQEKFDNDHTSFTAVLGSALIVFAAILAWFNKVPSFEIAAVVIGAILLVLGLILRHMSADKQIRNTEALLALERERTRFAQRSAVFEHLWLHGQPKNMTADQLRFFLGDSTMPARNEPSIVPSDRQLPDADSNSN
jgi:hypothetical protein